MGVHFIILCLHFLINEFLKSPLTAKDGVAAQKKEQETLGIKSSKPQLSVGEGIVFFSHALCAVCQIRINTVAIGGRENQDHCSESSQCQQLPMENHTREACSKPFP